MSLPLTGVKVVELGIHAAGPSSSRFLGEMGAEVIKIESPMGDPWRITGYGWSKHKDECNPIYDLYNAGKKNLCLNLKSEQGKECMYRILEQSDVFISNNRLPALEKLGLDPDFLHEKFPQLIIGTIDGYGKKGPDATSPGFDIIAFWNRSGFLRDMPTETPGGYPMYGPTGIGDGIAGAFLAAGICACLYNRERTGRGEIVDNSLYGSAIWSMASMIVLSQEQYGNIFPKKRLDFYPIGAGTAYKCADGEWFSLSTSYERDAAKVWKLFDMEDLVASLNVTDTNSCDEHSRELIPVLEEKFKTKTADEWVQIFRDLDIVAGKCVHMKDVSKDEQGIVNNYINEFTNRDGSKCMMPRSPVHFASARQDPVRPASLKGADTENVLQEYGFSADEIQSLYDSGSVY